jgi:hypothetical protein
MSRVTLSDYIQSRSINKKLYDRLVKLIESKCKKLLERYTDIEICITMSAKYQTPMVSISNGSDTIPDYVGKFEYEIMDAIDEVGFTYSESEERNGRYYLNFYD